MYSFHHDATVLCGLFRADTTGTAFLSILQRCLRIIPELIPNGTAPCLKRVIYGSCCLISRCRVKKSPFSPDSGEKVAARPDEGEFCRWQHSRTAPSPRPSPPIFAAKLPCETTSHPQKIEGEGATWRCPSECMVSVVFRPNMGWTAHRLLF